MSEVIRIIAAVIDTKQLTMYREDGSTIIVPQGDPRIQSLVDKVIPDIESQKFCDLTQEELEASNCYKDAEESMKGAVKFFRMAKDMFEDLVKKFDALTGNNVVAPRQAGEVPGEILPPQTKSREAVAEIMKHAKPAASSDFAATNEKETVVAVVDGETLIPGIEQIEVQLQSVAAKLGSAEGVANFFRRLAAVERRHSVSDLLKFMEKGELPIADDGSVLVYKRLLSTSEEGVFVDCHSKNVRQRVGSLVCMAEKLVDPNRNNECSNGLHVARRDYLSSFSGDVTVLAKLAPEDVIAVPHGDARKLRARAYHIVARLSDEDARAVCSNQQMSDKVLLGNVAAGNHVGVLEEVEITAHYGGGLKIRKIEQAPAEVVIDESLKTESLDNVEQAAEVTVNAAAVAKKVSKAKANGKSVRQLEAEELARVLRKGKTLAERQEAAKSLSELKKRAKVSWPNLGLPHGMSEEIAKVLTAKEKPAKAAKAAAPVAPATGSPREQIQAILKGKKLDMKAAEKIVEIKRRSKKSWDKLGVSAADLKKIESLLK